MNIARRVLQSLKARSFKSNESGWYCRNLEAEVEHVYPAGVRMAILSGAERGGLFEWLRLNHEQFPWMYFPEEIEAAKANDHIFPSAYAGDTLIGFVKVGVRQVYIHDFERLVDLPGDVAFVYDIFVHPKYRRMGLAGAMIQVACRFLQGDGYRAVFCHIEDWNLPSIRAFESSGFSRVGTIGYRRLGWASRLRIDSTWAAVDSLTDWLRDQWVRSRLTASAPVSTGREGREEGPDDRL